VIDLIEGLKDEIGKVTEESRQERKQRRTELLARMAAEIAGGLVHEVSKCPRPESIIDIDAHAFAVREDIAETAVDLAHRILKLCEAES
jgi:hypothetical protein